ncbi:hypothetical protein Tco_0770462 [Tanacetum coccineum]|uniref:Reverse transcriptase domain-containing protein n=1 Tax=Tanacetum coccineum TaxID=301880 RepID=A0ABQ4ZEY5_9ASTR
MSIIQKCVAMSTTEAEYMAIAEACKELVWLKNFLEELDRAQTECVLFCDNQSVILLAKNPVFHGNSRIEENSLPKCSRVEPKLDDIKSLKDEGVAAGSHYGSGADQISANLRRTLAPSVGPEILISTNEDSPGGTSAPAGQAQGGLSPAFMKENIDVLRTMIKMGPSTEEVGGYSSDGSSRSRSRGLRSRSKSKSVKSASISEGLSKEFKFRLKEQRSRRSPKYLFCRSRASGGGSHAGMVQDVPPADLEAFWARNWFDSLDPKSVDGFEELSNKFLEEFSQQKRGGFTPLTKTPKEILAMDNVNFPPPPPMIKEAVASGILAHLVKDIRQGGQKGKSSAKRKEKVINMAISLKASLLSHYGCQILGACQEGRWEITKKDEEKTAFHIEEGVFCYMKMPFGLKNAGATYQRLVDSAFKEQIGVNPKKLNLDYMRDSCVGMEQDIIKDIEQTFSTLRRINMKLNPKKCSFGMEEGKFLGCIVTLEGIRANPEKAKAIMDMPSPKTLKQMQS